MKTKVNDFFKKMTCKKDFEISKSKDVVCDAYDIIIHGEKSPIIVTLNKVTADTQILVVNTGKVISGNMYDYVHIIKTTKYDSIEESYLMNSIYKMLLKKYKFMFDNKNINKIHLTYDRTF